ncbi:nuclear transcription factor Y subunit B-9-like [Pistacia vera]|uniref:nuclear transcription factor Y subunit B-9-like n=1 Tax=Pistacia vera TaxID=55513 RepID=UPI001263DE3B|nr:nuclear transcription factor Y subunit B-9-like [Pistacia vera]
MERADGFSQFPNKLARTSSALNIHPRDDSTAPAVTPTSAATNITTSDNNIINMNDNNNQSEQQKAPQPPSCFLREQDQYLPIANVIRIMRRGLPPHAKISDDAKGTVQECVSEFISFITGEANDRCHHELRKTITAEDIIWAMGKLGFDNYLEPLTLFLSRYREGENQRNSTRREPNMGHRAVDYRQVGVPGPHESVYNLGPHQGFYDPYTGLYFRDGSGSSSGGGSNVPDFDPFAHFK